LKEHQISRDFVMVHFTCTISIISPLNYSYLM